MSVRVGFNIAVTYQIKKKRCVKMLFFVLKYQDRGSVPLLALTDSPHLQLFQIRSLHADHSSQQLVLQTVSGHCEIYERALGLQLGLVMRAGQLGVQDEAESRVVLALLVSDLYVPVWVNEERNGF